MTGIQTQVSINDRQLSVCEAVDKNLEEEYVEEINESSDKCREPENLVEFARNDMQSWTQHRFERHDKHGWSTFGGRKCTRMYQSKCART